MKKLSKEEFIEKANKVHNGKYDYSKVEYVNSSTKICIICPIHGEFWQNPNSHLNGSGCKKCFRDKLSEMKKIDFSEIQEKIGGDVILDKNTYIDTKHQCKAKCTKCGNEWLVKPNDLLNGHGCSVCANEKAKYTQEQVIKMLESEYGEEFLYDKVNYQGSKQKLTLICSKCGREKVASFNRLMTTHVNCACSYNFKKSKLETLIGELLTRNNIEFVEQMSFDWLKNKYGRLTLDFYLPKYNIAIECQGIQHFMPSSFGETDAFINERKLMFQKERDERKKRLCETNNIRLIYFLEEKYVPYMSKDDVYFTNEDGLIEYINMF